ncbi:MFS transporter [Acidianus manzaensis]|uniref:MFS transporter n=1 Tax=Acidianus manzaensis TaxID=282676 RepID=A0A1W6JZ42_9CREN|nr:MFS transporter [Acidianus manzaensis]ARM75505.1 MFS transporter [Acidianus manzaensis]
MNRNTFDITLLLISRITRSITAGFISVVIGLYFLHIGLNLVQIGILFGIGAFASPLIAFFFSIYADIKGRKLTLLITLAFLPISIAILLLTKNFYLLGLASALGGFGIAGGLVGGGVGATVAPIQTAILAEKTDNKERTRIYSIFTLASTYAGAAGALFSHIQNYNELFIIGFILSLISFIASIPIRTQAIIKKKEEVEVRKKDLDVIRKFTYTGIFNGIAQGLITPFIPVIFEKFYNLSQGEIGNIVFFGGIVSATIMFLTPYFTEHLGFVKFIIITRAISSILVLAFPFLRTPLLAETDYVIFTTFRVFALPSQQALMMNLISERRRATASGINQTARLLPSALSTSISGVLLTIGLSIPFVSSFVVNIFNLFLYYKFFWNIPEAQAKKKVSYIPRET